uniref:Mitochondrial import inner membrane translocase subunit TIM22 n=1 Tax=Aegilops tauschii subsp. strangulata TaxID=200361 RepID=A0A453N9W5_AEGTS
MASPEPSAGGDAASQSAAVQPLQLPTPEEIKGQEMMNNCAVRSVLSGVMAVERLLFGGAPLSAPPPHHLHYQLFLLAPGGGLGVLMGLFFGALENPIMSEEMTARQQIVYQAKQMGRKSMSHAKTFAVMGLIFSAAECVVEKV